MFVKVQVDNSCFHILGSTKTSPSRTLGVSIPTNSGLSPSPLEKVDPTWNKQKERPVGLTLKKFNGYNKQRHDDGVNSNHLRVLEENPDEEDQKKRKPIKGSSGISQKTSLELKFKGLEGNGSVGEVQTKCSTKWASYGGCLPLILQALETIRDLDEAFRPWEDTLSNKERSIILKEQSSWERAVEIFEWFKRKGCYELNVIHYNIMLRILGKVRKWRYVECLWCEMNVRGISPINSTYGTLIDVYSKGGRREEALCWLERMEEVGMEPDEVTTGIVMQMYKNAGEFQKAEEIFRKWSSGGSWKRGGRKKVGGKLEKNKEGNASLSSYTYNTLIDMYGKMGQLKEASNTFARMLRQGIVPTTVTFNTMIHIFGNHGQLEEVASLMRKMEELRCPSDTRTFNILIFVHAKHDDINMAESYFKRMKQAGLVPDLVSYRTLLYALSIRQMVGSAETLVYEMDAKGLEIDEYTQSALTRMYIEAGMLEKSWLWFRRFHLTGKMSSDCYSANIDAYGVRGLVLEAEKVFACCQEVKKLSVLEFNVMIKAYGLDKNYGKACQLFDTMEKNSVVPDECSYNSIIQILASGDLPDRAKYYLRKMQVAGLVGDCIPYSAVITSFVKLGKLDEAEEVYKQMVQFNVKPDVILYGVLINAFADVGSIKDALRYVESMKKAGIPGNAVIYNSLIKLYTNVGYLTEAQETYKLLQLSDVGPDVYSSNCMIDLYSEQSMLTQAEEIFESLKKKGDANEFTFAMMLCLYRRLGRFEDAIQMAKQMKDARLLTDLLSYNNVLGLYAANGRFREAVGTFEEMLASGIQPDDFSFRSLGVVLLKCGVSKQAIGNLETRRKRDAQSGLQAWTLALSSLFEVEYDDGNDDGV